MGRCNEEVRGESKSERGNDLMRFCKKHSMEKSWAEDLVDNARKLSGLFYGRNMLFLDGLTLLPTVSTKWQLGT